MTEKIVESIHREPTVSDARLKKRNAVGLRITTVFFQRVFRQELGKTNFARKRRGIRVAAYRKKMRTGDEFCSFLENEN